MEVQFDTKGFYAISVVGTDIGFREVACKAEFKAFDDKGVGSDVERERIGLQSERNITLVGYAQLPDDAKHTALLARDIMEQYERWIKDDGELIQVGQYLYKLKGIFRGDMKCT